MWGTAADFYRVGNNILKTKELIEKYNDAAEDLSADVTVLPYGPVPGRNADDHVHFDLGYITVVPREISEDRMEQPQEARPLDLLGRRAARRDVGHWRGRSPSSGIRRWGDLMLNNARANE